MTHAYDPDNIRRWPPRWPIDTVSAWSTGHDGDGCQRGLYKRVAHEPGYREGGWTWLAVIPYVLERITFDDGTPAFVVALTPDAPDDQRACITERNLKIGGWGWQLDVLIPYDQGICRRLRRIVLDLADHLDRTGESR